MRPDARREAGDVSPCQRRHETMYRGALTRSDGGVLEVAPGFPPF